MRESNQVPQKKGDLGGADQILVKKNKQTSLWNQSKSRINDTGQLSTVQSTNLQKNIMALRQHPSFLSEPLAVTEVLQALQQNQSLAQTNLQGINLSQMDLSGIDLSGANLIGANLSQANFQGANLQGVDLRRANLRDANLSGANLQESYLFRANLQGCNLVDANLIEAKLKFARYDAHTLWPEGFNYKNSGAIGPKASLCGAFLNTANLRGADLSYCNLRGAYLSGADLTGANLEGAALSGASLQNAFLTGAYLRNAILIGVELQGADLRAADLTGANLEQLKSIAGADFSLVQGLSEQTRAMLCSRGSQELGTWNAFTRNYTAQSLGCHMGGN
jgi:uncharacterized protein YjbI with pentapeptide repeats